MKKFFSNKTVQDITLGLVFLVSFYIFQNKNWIVGGLLVIGEVAAFLAVVQKPRPVATLPPTVEVDSDLLRIVIEEVVAEMYGPQLSAPEVNIDLVRHLVSEALRTQRFTLEEDGTLAQINPSIPDWMSSMNAVSDDTPDWLKGMSETPPADDGKPKRTRKVAGK